MEAARRASQRLRPFDECKAEIIDFTNIGHLGQAFQGLGGDLFIKEVKNVTPHGHREPPNERFDWLFNRRIRGHLYIARLYEAGVVDHLFVIDSRQWPSFIYESCDPSPLILSSYSLFQCCDPDANKVKITQLFEVILDRRSGEKPKNQKKINIDATSGQAAAG